MDNEFYEEENRLKTYLKHWPIETMIKASDCAREGFYYTGVADIVQCAFCGGTLRNWKNGDTPQTQHQTFFSFCPFVKGSSGNVQADNAVRHDRGMNYELARPPPNAPPPLEGRKDEFEDLGERRKTYRQYPPSSAVPPDSLCAAGFYYLESTDLVKCFWCQGQRSGWAQGDDPWLYHAMMFPGCMWLQKQKGLQYIREARAASDSPPIADHDHGDLSFLTSVDPPVAGAKLPTKPAQTRSLYDWVEKKGDYSEAESVEVAKAIMCIRCMTRTKAAALMPCANFCVCLPCAQNNCPDKCPSCGGGVAGYQPINIQLGRKNAQQ